MDGYRRGTEVERAREGDPEVTPLYRPVVPVVWLIGALLLVVVLSVAPGLGPGLAVVLVSHLFAAGLVRADIGALRRQGVDWGPSRHLWFGAALTLPLVPLAYYVYSGRIVRRENDRRGVDRDDEGDGDDGA